MFLPDQGSGEDFSGLLDKAPETWKMMVAAEHGWEVKNHHEGARATARQETHLPPVFKRPHGGFCIWGGWFEDRI
jgi:hypothetical protein